jgi:hypothetical protein
MLDIGHQFVLFIGLSITYVTFDLEDKPCGVTHFHCVGFEIVVLLLSHLWTYIL